MNDWEDIKIIDAFEFTKKSPKMKISKDDILPFIKMEDIPLTRIYADQFISKKYSDISSATYFENGDLLLAKITPSFENGKQGIAHIESTFGFATTEVIPIKAKIGISDIRYLFFYLKNQTVRKELAGKMEGSTGRQRLRKELLENRIISLPSLNEQHKITYTHSAIQEAIETQEKIIKTT